MTTTDDGADDTADDTADDRSFSKIYTQKGLGLDINGCPNWPLGECAHV